ncbi:alginate lyase family protein [Paraflavisolibacter sp. H34]|uniref:alginate lyase family protein n=1 Tax=Huijunlia imazamoxiresistens TaxID=3127457 RepID=UPI00301B68C5
MNKQFSFIRFFILLAFCFAFALHGQAKEGEGCMHPKEQIAFVRQQVKQKKEPYYSAFRQLLVQADSALLVTEHAVEDFRVPGFYSDKDGHRKQSLALQVDGFSAYSCALAWQLTGKKKYADKARYFLNAWATKNKTYSLLDGSLVLSYSGTTLMITAQLLKDYKKFTPAEQQQFATWTRDVFRKAANSIRYRNNNSGDWSRFASLLADCYLGDKEDFQQNVSMIKKDLFEKIAPDGHMVEEVKRQGNGIWYTYFSLAPLTASCWVIYNFTGENLFFQEKNGASIKKALDYLLHHNQHPGEWSFFKNPVTGDEHTATGFWPANLLEAMGPVYGSDAYRSFVAPYRPIMYPRHDYAWTFPTLMPLSLNGYK